MRLYEGPCRREENLTEAHRRVLAHHYRRIDSPLVGWKPTVRRSCPIWLIEYLGHGRGGGHDE